MADLDEPRLSTICTYNSVGPYRHPTNHSRQKARIRAAPAEFPCEQNCPYDDAQGKLNSSASEDLALIQDLFVAVAV